MECLGIRRERKKHILSRLAARSSDLLLHPEVVVFKKSNSVAIPVQEGIVNFVRSGLVILSLRIIDAIESGIQSDQIRVGGRAPRS